MVKADEKVTGVSFVDFFHMISYMEDHYGCQVELHFCRNEVNNRNALLCITVVGNCKLHRTRTTYDYASVEVTFDSLSRVPTMALELFYELIERLDGSCTECISSSTSVR